jgi:hypothetical protein
MSPNRQRDKTPEARPLRQQCLKRRKRLAPLIQEGPGFTDRFDELVLVTANFGEAQEESRLYVCLMRSVANRMRGCPAERRWRSLSGKAP